MLNIKTNLRNVATIAACLAVTTMFLGCEKKDNPDSPNSPFTRMDIDEARTLFIASSDNGTSKLYGVKKTSSKSTSENEVIYEIKYLNENGEQIEKNNPRHIFDAGDFLIICFGDPYRFEEAYFVKRTDGLVYAIPREYLPHLIGNKYRIPEMFFSTVDKIQVDMNKNIYYSSYDPRILYKVSSIASSAIQFTQVSAVNDDIWGACVDGQGNIFYSTGHQFDYKTRYRKVDGGFVSIPDTEHPQHVWKGIDGIMYGLLSKSYDTYLVKIQEGEVSEIKKLGEFWWNSFFSDGNRTPHDGVFHVQGRIILRVGYNIVDISSETLYKEVTTTVVANTVFNDQLYYFDDKTFSCTHINIHTGETSVLFALDKTALSNFDIDKILNISEDGVEFNAVQLSNGNYVVAKIGLDNVVTIQQSISGKISIIMPLNL